MNPLLSEQALGEAEVGVVYVDKGEGVSKLAEVSIDIKTPNKPDETVIEAVEAGLCDSQKGGLPERKEGNGLVGRVVVFLDVMGTQSVVRSNRACYMEKGDAGKKTLGSGLFYGKIGKRGSASMSDFPADIRYGETYRKVGSRWKRHQKLDASKMEFFGKKGEDDLATKEEKNSEQKSDENSPQNKAAEQNTGENNRFLNDTNSSQTLTSSQIVQLKQSVDDGAKLVGMLVANSASFKKKTEFAQCKYVKKKQHRHVEQVSLLEPTMWNVCETHHISHNARHGNLRGDTLGHLLVYGEICASKRVAVFDHSRGILTGAILTKMRGSGTVFQLTGSGISDVRAGELASEEDRSLLRPVPLYLLERHFNLNHISGPSTDDAVPLTSGCLYPLEGAAADLVRERVDSFVAIISPLKKPPGKMEKKQSAIKLDLEAHTDHATLISKLLQLAHQTLLPDGRIAIFGPHFEPLAKWHAILHKSPLYTHVKLEEYFLREHQVLDQRTHPIMESGIKLFPGYILTAIRLLIL